MKHSVSPSQFEEYIRTAVIEFEQEELENILEKSEIDDFPTPSPFFLIRMKKLIRLERRRRWKKRLLKGMKHAAVWVIILFSSLAGLMLINQDARASIQQFFKEIYEEYTHITFSWNQNGTGNELEMNYQDYLPEYLPEGYEYVGTLKRNERISVVYSNGENKDIIYSISNSNIISNYNLDKEYTTCQPIFIHGQPAQLYLSTIDYFPSFLLYSLEKQSLEKETIVILIKGYLSEAELIKIAESVKLK